MFTLGDWKKSDWLTSIQIDLVEHETVIGQTTKRE